jgi:phenylacetate-CoA ligase
MDRDYIRRLQERKLRNLVRHAFDTVRFYRMRFKTDGVRPEDIGSIEDLNRIPTIRKSDLQSLSLDQIISNRYSFKELKIEHTSGSTGQPFSVYLDADFVMLRNLLFLRGLKTCGYNFGRRILLITDIKEKSVVGRFPGWHYVSILQTPDYHLKILNQIKPSLLYGCKTSLKLLAQYIETTRANAYTPKQIISTAESLDNSTRSLMREVFRAEVYDFYGLTEMGLVGWECPIHRGYHLSEDATILEFVPSENGLGACSVVMTNLHSMAMPLIRFETGDIVFPGENRPCPCGRSFAMFKRVEGRMADVIHTKGGTKISPYRVTCALERLSGLRTYQVIQESLEKFLVRIETDRYSGGPSEEKIRSVLCDIIGGEVDITIEKQEQIIVKPGTKFRIVESHVGR